MRSHDAQSHLRLSSVARASGFRGGWKALGSLASPPTLVSADARLRSAIKRALDISWTLVTLALLWPLMLAVAVLVKLDSKGPALFRQVRLGKDGAAFTLYKFRSMRADCDSSVHRQHVTRLIKGIVGEEARGSSGSFKLQADARVTRLGKVLRRTSVDELPQLFNVLKGDMSLVGPRPPLPYEVEAYTSRHWRRLEVLPGITGLWQVSGRTELSFEEMVDLDIRYIETWSIGLDVHILLKTVPAVLGRRGAG